MPPKVRQKTPSEVGTTTRGWTTFSRNTCHQKWDRKHIQKWPFSRPCTTTRDERYLLSPGREAVALTGLEGKKVTVSDCNVQAWLHVLSFVQEALWWQFKLVIISSHSQYSHSPVTQSTSKRDANMSAVQEAIKVDLTGFWDWVMQLIIIYKKKKWEPLFLRYQHVSPGDEGMAWLKESTIIRWQIQSPQKRKSRCDTNLGRWVTAISKTAPQYHYCNNSQTLVCRPRLKNGTSS